MAKGPMNLKALGRKLKWHKCVECGECLRRCQYMEFSPQQALAEIKLINQGQAQTSRVLNECTSCYACNAFCPEDAHPYERIRSLYSDDRLQEGLPLRTSYLMPTRRPNFREDLFYTPAERKMHKRWAADQPPGPVCLYPGCNLLSMPFLAQGKIFEHLPVWGRWDLCCTEMLWRMGLRDPVEAQGQKLLDFYKNKPIEEMVFMCPAGYNMFRKIYPEQFGIIFPFKVTFFSDWLLAQQAEGKLQYTRKLKGSVVVHDSCHGRVMGAEFLETQRSVLRATGVQVFDSSDQLSEGLCCGIATGCRRFSVVDLVQQGLRELKLLQRAPGDRIAVYCTGCLLTFNALHLVRPFDKQVVHTLELVRQALGETPHRRHSVRALQMVAGIARHALPHYFSKRKFLL